MNCEMPTDVLGSVQLGYHTVPVLSGGTIKDELQHFAYRPESIVQSLAQLAELLDRSDWQPTWCSPLALGVDSPAKRWPLAVGRI
jgi:NagD protein